MSNSREVGDLVESASLEVRICRRCRSVLDARLNKELGYGAVLGTFVAVPIAVVVFAFFEPVPRTGKFVACAAGWLVAAAVSVALVQLLLGHEPFAHYRWRRPGGGGGRWVFTNASYQAKFSEANDPWARLRKLKGEPNPPEPPAEGDPFRFD